MASAVTILFFISNSSRSSGTAVISLDFSSVTISPKVTWFSATKALTTWYALWLWFPLPQIVLPSTAITLPSFRLLASQSYRLSASILGFNRSKIRRNVSLSGIPFGSSRKFLSHSSRSLPKSSISEKSLPLHTRVHNPIIKMSSNLCSTWPRSVLLGSSTFSSAVFNLSISIPLFYHVPTKS